MEAVSVRVLLDPLSLRHCPTGRVQELQGLVRAGLVEMLAGAGLISILEQG